jgi:hypothetical protein
MSTYLDALLSGQSKARSLATSEDAIEVDVAESTPPNPGDVLTAVDSSHATWQPPSGGGTASELGSTGAPINVDGAAPPVPGQVLTAVDPEHAEWRVPGLHYDPSIKFWTASVGSATIASGTWGFVEQAVDAVDPIVVYIVSSLEAPPVDARFGLYVGRDVTVPVSVSVLGASQIQGLDGELGPSTPLLPGADYEWVFYHEDGAALWGLVSDTAAVAKYLWVDGGIVELRTSPPPNPGDVLTAVDASEAVWMAPSGGGHGLDYASGSSPEIGQWVIAANNTDVVLPMPSEAGQRVGVYMAGADNVNVTSDAYIVLGRNTAPSHPLRPGGWYEWASMDFGEDIRWVPHGGQGDEARPPLEDGGGATSTPAMPNQWILAPNGGVANAPSNPQNGDSFAVYVNGASASVVAAAGHSIVSPDGTTIVASPSALALPGNTYYEWIWIDSTLQWKPKNYLDAPGNGLIRSGKTLAVGANADGSIVVNADDIRVGVLATDAQHGVRGGGTTHALATGSANGFLSSADFTKLAALSQAYKAPVRVVATNNEPTATTGGTSTIDGVTTVLGDRVLLAFQTDATARGIYIVSASAWPRASDADTSGKLPSGAIVPVSEGAANQDTVWTLTTNEPITLGTTSLTFTQNGGLRSASIPSGIQAAASTNGGVSTKWAASDHVHAATALDPSYSNFRLSNNATSLPTSGTASTLTLAPHNGHRISLYNGTDWINCTPSSNPTLALTGLTTGIPCDIFAVYSSLTAATLEAVPWTNATTRSTALVQFNGVWTKTSFPNRRYVGTILPDSAASVTFTPSASGAAFPICAIWNQDNRIRGQFTWTPTFDSWTIPSADTWQQINAQASAKIQLVQGQAIDAISAQHIAAVNAAGSSACVGIGLDSTTAPTGLRDMSSVSGSLVPVRANLHQQLATPGAHTLNALAIATSTAAIFYGAHGSMQGGITAELWY